MAKKNNDSITYLEKTDEGFGGLIISGLAFPKTAFFDPLAKIWSSVRKRIMEQYNVDVAGVFVYDERIEVISCSFCLNYGALPNGDSFALYTDRFKETFERQMLLFEEVIDAFVLDQIDGYDAYIELVNSRDCTPEKCKKMLNVFLKKINVRTERDERRSAKRAAKKAKAAEKLARKNPLN